jgi:hypothetical protein
VKLHGLARVKTEGDVIEEFVRHNVRYLDAMTVVDNQSLDGTVGILEALRDEGLPLRILHDDLLPRLQYKTITRVARESLAEGWDFLFLLDADEFIKVSSRAELEASLATLPSRANGLLPWATYVTTAADQHDEPRVSSRIRYRQSTESEHPFWKCVVSREFAEVGDLRIAQGNHIAHNALGSAAAVVPAVSLAHFPARSIAQLQQKVLLGWGAYLATANRDAEWGWHQRRLFERLEAGGQWTPDDLHEIGMHYVNRDTTVDTPRLVFDPLPPVEVRRYGSGATTEPLQLAARFIRQLAEACAERAVSAERSPPKATDS